VPFASLDLLTLQTRDYIKLTTKNFMPKQKPPMTPSDEAIKLHGYGKELPEVRAMEAMLLTINPDKVREISQWVRRSVYMLGLDGGYEGILGEAKEAANREQREIDKLSDPLNQEDANVYRERLKFWRNFLSMRALSIADQKKQKAVIGNINARFRTEPQPEKIATGYFDEQGKLVREINKRTPLDELMDIIAFTDNGKYVEYETEERKFDPKLLEAMRRNAHASLIDLLISGDKDFIEVARQFLTYADYSDILARSPGALSEGRIGKKAAGMYLAYAVLEKESPEFDRAFAREMNLAGVSPDTMKRAEKLLKSAENMSGAERMERRDEILQAQETIDDAEKLGLRRLQSALKNVLQENNSFFIGSELMKELISNNQQTLAALTVLKYMDEEKLNDKKFMAEVEKSIREAEFPDHLQRQLKDLFESLKEKTGGNPVIVRSSSALEDQAGASFAGMYESKICPGDDFEKFLDAIKTVYVSVFSAKVMRYRKQKGLIDFDETMGLLVQELNGESYGKYFFPDISGVALSHAPQSAGPDPSKGMMTVVAGLGEKVVTTGGKIVWLENPNFDFGLAGGRGYQQEDICVFDREDGTIKYVPVSEVINGEDAGFDSPTIKDIFADENDIALSTNILNGRRLHATFKGMLAGKPPQMPLIIQYYVKKLEHALGYKVDIEFTAARQKNGEYRVKLVQCRPQNIAENLKPAKIPAEVPPERVMFRTKSSLSNGHAENVRYMLYISPEAYNSGHEDQLTHDEMNALHQYIARFNNAVKEKDYLIVAPGRWGDNPESELGVYAVSGDYDRTAGIVEVVGEGHWKGVPPSAGTHDFQLIIERGICTFGVDLSEEKHHPLMVKESLDSGTNILGRFVKDVPERLARWIKVVDAEEVGRATSGEESNWRFNIAMNNIKDSQEAVVYLAAEGEYAPVKGTL
jgi:hypothetical protein